jgi:NifB/MoaA-like Fe-S oxidoreductase
MNSIDANPPRYRRSQVALSPVAKPKYEETLEELLDIVSLAREDLVAVERKLERLRAEIAKAQNQNNGSSRKTR